MIKNILQRFGYIRISDADAEKKKEIDAIMQSLSNVKPGDEIITASRHIRKFGFKIVYALGDDCIEKNAIGLFRSLLPSPSLVSESTIRSQFLPNIIKVDDVSLLR